MEKVKGITNPNQLKDNQFCISQGNDKSNFYINLTDNENETLRTLLKHFINYGLIPNHYKNLLKSLLDKSHCVLVWGAQTITPYFMELETDYNTMKHNNNFIFA